MIARPPEKNLSSKTTNYSPLFSKIANDNRPPKRNLFGWIFLVFGLLLSLGAFFWIYEKTILYYQVATQWRTDEEALDREKARQTDNAPKIDKAKRI